jgi:DNA-binding SARP family transcriptional activator/tetratricopeptide (TPR) repeat protein
MRLMPREEPDTALSAGVQLTLAGVPSARRPPAKPVMLSVRDAALLAWLALEGPTPRTRLAELLWPESEPGVALNALRQRVFQLRRPFGDGLLVGHATLSLAEGVTHDLTDSDGVLGIGTHALGPELLAWLALQRGRRRQRVRQSLADLSDMAEQARDYADALSHAHELLALEPLSEEAHRRVIRLHYLAGDRPGALLAFDRCEQVLKHEVGVAPSPETLALLQTIQCAGSVGASQRPVVPAAVLRPPRRIGHGPAWQALCRARDEQHTVLLAGEAGMGKSRLLADLLQTAPGAALLVSARPGDAAAPYAVLARCLRSLMKDFGLVPAAPQRGMLARLLPELGTAEPMSHEDDLLRLTHALSSVLDDAIAHGLRCVLVDDLQFADAASVELLRALIAGSACSWVVAMRPNELGLAARGLVDGLERSAEVSSLALQALQADEVAELLASLEIDGIGSVAQAESLQQRTGGNPMYLLETLKAAFMTVPAARAVALAGEAAAGDHWPSAPNVTRLIQQRLMRLSPLALRVARCAAVAGQDASAPLIAQVLGLRPLDLADAWGELEDAQVLRAGEHGGGRFAHDLIAEATLASVPHAIAQPLHGEVAAWLEQQQGEPARIANHWLAARQPLRAVPVLSQAADKARAGWRLQEAAALHRQAADILRDAGRRAEAFGAYFAAANVLAAVALDARLVELRDEMEALAEDDGQRAMLAVLQQLLLVENRRHDEAWRVTLRAVPQAQRAGLPEIEAELCWAQAVMHWARRELADAVRMCELALALLTPIDRAHRILQVHDTELKLTHALGMFLGVAGRYEESNTSFLEALRQAERSNDQRHCMDLERVLSKNALEQGHPVQALRWSTAAMGRLEGLPMTSTSATVVIELHAQVAAAAGQLGEALSLHERVQQLSVTGISRNHVYPLVRRAVFLHEIGRRDLGLKALRALHDDSRLLLVERALVDAALIRVGEPADAGTVLEQVGVIDDFSLRVLILCLARRGCDPAAVLPLLGVSLATARECGAHGLWLSLQVQRVAALRAAGRVDEAAAGALVAWQRIDEGLGGRDLLPELAAELYAALAGPRADAAAVIALRASAWMQAAASTLPAPWRDNYLQRAPALATMTRPLLAMPRD